MVVLQAGAAAEGDGGQLGAGCYVNYVGYVGYVFTWYRVPGTSAPQVQEMPPRICTLRVSLEGKTPTGPGLTV